MGIIIGNLLIAVGQILSALIHFYYFVLLGRIIISWVNADPYNPIVRFLTSATEPLLGRIRRWIPFRSSGIDFSPMALILIFYFFEFFLVATLIDVGMRIKIAGIL